MSRTARLLGLVAALLFWGTVGLTAEPVAFNSGFIAVTEADTTLVEVSLGGRGGLVNATVINTEPNDLAECRVDLKDSAGGTFYSYVSGTMWTDPNYGGLVQYASTSPATLAAGGTAHVRFRVGAAHAFRVVLACGTSESTTAHVSGIAAIGLRATDPNKLGTALPAGYLFVGGEDNIAASVALIRQALDVREGGGRG